MIKRRKNFPDALFNDSGSPDRPLYVLDGDHLIECGVENTDELIQSYKDSTDLNLLLQRLTDIEYENLVNSRQVFMDTTQFPQTLADIKNFYNDSTAKFNSLPEDVKKELGSLQKLGKMSDDDFAKFILDHATYESPVVESEVTE